MDFSQLIHAECFGIYGMTFEAKNYLSDIEMIRIFWNTAMMSWNLLTARMEQDGIRMGFFVIQYKICMRLQKMRTVMAESGLSMDVELDGTND